ncbi:septum formation initiator family protein [Micrococcus luteus]|uniref:FtsB family cell division protein n=1 Tax=Micrococcus TaxID=1269 RepID=UPI000C9AA021|nr:MULTISPECIES: septum formation initiator family protein [Micrococcus]AWD24675.1 septum formation initiator family protein [Micrococcus luteus]MCV7454493.1 septum formation initiator family protein [Micrococcus luteus]MCV7479320.1 septum formation initiator family protein [Micrococcus luteus]MCV7524417.1 septum formation initiator family protein [Micrococcus luteus]MCV7613855.1 septum formation initiator family protein [Micrococcus luteus]
MSPRRPRVPRVDPTTGAPRRTAVAAPAAPTTASPKADAPTPTPEATTPTPAATGAEVIDLHSVQERRQAGHHGHLDGHPDADRADTAPAAPASPSAPPRRTAPARPAGRRTRPAPRRAASAAATAARRRAPLPEPVPARQITGRSLIVVAVLLLAAVLVAPTLRAFLNQQLEISAAREEIAAMQAQREDYERRIQLWDDPAYVTQQARERLELVMPGETLYSVTGRPSETDTDTETEDTPAADADEVVNTRLPWAEGLWDSAVRAGLE